MLAPLGRRSAKSQGDRNQVNLLAELDASSVQALWRIGVQRRYRDNQLVQQRGDSATHALILISGRLRSTACSVGGTEQFIRWMEPGELAGLSSVLADAPVPVDLIAVGPTELLLLPSQPLRDLLLRDGATCLLMARMLSLRVNELFDVIFSRAGDSLAARVWDTVQRLALENGNPLSNGSVALQLSQTDLARAVGASRQRVNVHLRELQRCGRLRLGYGQIEVL